MPLFHRKSEEEKRREDDERRSQAEAAARAEASLASLAAGGIPISAQQRLATLQESDGAFFTSDLSVNEFLLTGQTGMRPVSQVMGSSVYHVGWKFISGAMSSGEITSATNALNAARSLALGRLAEEARRAGADVVVGVHLMRKDYDWADDMIEFNAMGTAMRFERSGSGDVPALTNLSGQDFWKLYRNGYWPVGVVAGSCVYHTVPTWNTWRATNTFFGGLWNQELTDFTRGLYAARHRAITHLQEQAVQLGAEGAVGMSIEHTTEEFEVKLGNDRERTDMIVTFQAIGTAIVTRRGTAEETRASSSLNLLS